jgi:hypothetical protein
MTKVIAVLALSAGGAATYVWLRKNGGASRLENRIDRAVIKVRGAFTNGDVSNDMAAQVKDKAHDVVGNVAEPVEAGNS